jgi:histone H3/H4
MISNLAVRRIIKDLNPTMSCGKETIEYLDNKTTQFITELMKHTIENTISQKKLIIKPIHIQQTLDKLSLILKIYPKTTQEEIKAQKNSNEDTQIN